MVEIFQVDDLINQENTISRSNTTTNNGDYKYTKCNNTTTTNTCTGKSTTTNDGCIYDDVACAPYPYIPSNKSYMYS